jgi:hypothetical protein
MLTTRKAAHGSGLSGFPLLAVIGAVIVRRRADHYATDVAQSALLSAESTFS